VVDACPTVQIVIQGIVFDLDETLLDRSKAVRLFAEEFFEQHSSRLVEGLVDGLAEGLTKAEFVTRVHALDGRGYTPREQFFALLATEFSLPSVEAADLRKMFFDSVWVRPILAEGAIQGLREYLDRGIKIGVVSNGSTAAQGQKMASSGLSELVHTCVISEEFGVKKPDPAIFLAACDRLEIEPDRSWFVGDHPVNDVWGSCQVGFKTGWVHLGRDWPQEYERCDDVSAVDLVGVLDQINRRI
jgi:putative hydrolase of the HAD superfamily